MRKKILVTGASGFIGRNALNLLVERDYEVHAISSKQINNKEKNIFWHKTNLKDLRQIDNIFKQIKPQYLLHLAWDVTPDKYKNSNENLIWVQTSIEIIKSFNKNGGKRAIFAGTCFEYDLRYGYLNEELTPIKPSTLYGTCKASLYNILQHYSTINNLSFAWARIFYLYGPHEHSKRIIPYIINKLLKGQVAYVSSGNQIRDFLHVYDSASAFVNILESDIKGAVNVGSGKSVILRDIFMKIGEQIGRADLINFGSLKKNQNEPKLIVADNARLINEVGWKQYYDLDKGIKETIDWWKNELIKKL